MRTLRRITTATAVAALALTTVAADGTGTAPSLDVTGSRAGNVVTFSGTAAGGADLGAQSINGLITDFQESNVGSAGQINLVDALMESTPDGINFTWLLDNLAAPPPPEGVRYTWSFAIDDATFQLQAKTTNLGSVTLADDPAGHVTNAGASFQVRGNCVAEYLGTPVANCPHIGWVEGAFNTSDNTVTMFVPYGFHEAIQPGVVVVEHQTASASVSANFQAVISNNTTGSQINAWAKPFSAGLVVYVSAASADTDLDKLKGGVPVELNEDGSFSGEIELEDDEVAFVRACTGFTCTAAMVA